MKRNDGIKVKGHAGTWYVIDNTLYKGVPVYLLESEIYGDAADHLIIDEDGNLLIENVCNSLDEELSYWEDSDEEKEWVKNILKVFAVHTITTGVIYSQGYWISTTVFRANREALTEYLDGYEWNDRLTYDTNEEYEEYHNSKIAIRKAWEDKVYKALGFEITEDMGASITQNVSEIFTAVIMRKAENIIEL